jgi:ABC-type transporter Mla subunit MlaD
VTLAVLDPADHVEQLVRLTERLTALLAEQAQLFEARRPQDAAAATAQSADLATLYRRESARIKANPAMLASAPPGQRKRLLEATRAFEATLKRHGRAVHACKTVTEGLVRAVADEVARRRAPPAGYGPRARPTAGDGSAITLNRRA